MEMVWLLRGIGMGIQKDAEEILVYFYKEYIKTSQLPNMRQEFIKNSGWDVQRIKRAIAYLDGKGFIEAKQMADGNYLILSIEPDGIDVIENESKFERQFNHKINLGLYEFSWGVKEK